MPKQRHKKEGCFIACTSGVESLYNLHYWHTKGKSEKTDTHCVYVFHEQKDRKNCAVPEYLSLKNVLNYFPQMNLRTVYLDTPFIMRFTHLRMYITAQFAINSIKGTFAFLDGENIAIKYEKAWVLSGQNFEEAKKANEDEESFNSSKAITDYINTIGQKKIEKFNPSNQLYKHEIIQLLPDHLLSNVWSCGSPIYKQGTYYSCDECPKCKELIEAHDKANKVYETTIIADDPDDEYVRKNNMFYTKEG